MGLNNNTDYYMHNIAIRTWIGLVTRLTDTRSAENTNIGADTDPEYRIDASLVCIHILIISIIRKKGLFDQHVLMFHSCFHIRVKNFCGPYSGHLVLASCSLSVCQSFLKGKAQPRLYPQVFSEQVIHPFTWENMLAKIRFILNTL